MLQNRKYVPDPGKGSAANFQNTNKKKQDSSNSGRNSYYFVLDKKVIYIFSTFLAQDNDFPAF